MNWIWTDNATAVTNTYAEFFQEFDYSGKDVILNISASDEYAVFLNGLFIECGQYDDYPDYKIYDSLDISKYCTPGKNELIIQVYYQGINSAQCIKSEPKLWYSLLCGDKTYNSGSDTLCRKLTAYTEGNIEHISPQLAFSFHYDARKYGSEVLTSAYCLSCNILLLPRPIKKLLIHPPSEGHILNQGVFISAPDISSVTPAERIYSDLIAPRYADAFVSYSHESDKIEEYTTPKLRLPSAGYTFSTPEKYDGTYMIVDLGHEFSGFVHLELDAAEGAVFDIAYGEHLDDGRVRSSVGQRNFAFSYTSRSGRQSFTHYFKRISGRYLELHARTDKPFTLYHLSIRHTEYPLNLLSYPESLTDSLARKIYDASVETLKLCMHEHFEDCPWREQAQYAMDSRNQALFCYYAFGEYDYPYACWKLFEPSLRSDGMFPITTPSESPKTIPSFTLVWVIACEELVSYGGQKYNTFGDTMRFILDKFSERAKNGILSSLEGVYYWNYFEWSDGLAGNNNKSDKPQESAALTLFFYAALLSYKKLFNDGRYAGIMKEIESNFHNTFWSEDNMAYSTFSDKKHFTELVQSLALLCGLVPEDFSGKLRSELANDENPWIKITLSHYIYKIDALMGEAEKYYNHINDYIIKTWGNMLFSGSTTFWETINGGDAFTKAGSLCHGWSAVPIYFWHKYSPNTKSNASTEN